jgi:hypothetical protein
MVTKKRKPKRNRSPIMFGKILDHPDYSEIINKLTAGVSVREVSKWLEEKYPRNKNLQIQHMTLQNFRIERLNIDKDVIKQLRDEQQNGVPDIKNLDIKADAILESIQQASPKESSYKGALNKSKEYSVHIPDELKQIVCLVKTKIEEYFNRSDAGTLTVMQEQSLQRFMKMWVDSIEKWGKYVEKIPDVSIEHNVNIQVMNDQLEMFKVAIQEVVAEFDAETAVKFYDKLNRKLSKLSYRAPRETGTGLTQLMRDSAALTEATLKEDE